MLKVSNAHGLILNKKKTEVLLFGKNKKELSENLDFKILIDNEVLTFSTYCKNLGLLLEVELKFTEHVNLLLKRSYWKLKLLYMHKEYLSSEVKLKLCDSLILSTLAYCDVVYWPALLKKDQESLQKIQNSCLRFCYNLRKFDHITEKLQQSKWLTLYERYKLHMACLLHKINESKCPKYLFEKLIRGADVHNCPTRYCNLYNVPKHNTAQFNKSFTYNATYTYNNLNCKINSNSSFYSLKKHIKEYLIAQRNLV